MADGAGDRARRRHRAAVILSRVLSLPLRVQPLSIGKVNTVVQVRYVGLLLLFLVFGIHAPQFAAGRLVAAGFTILSWFAYGRLWLRAFALGRRPA